MHFENFSDTAKLWVFQSNQPLDEQVQLYLKKQVAIFVDQWSAHGKKLTASAEVLDEYRFAICAEGNVEASGCSIDAMVRFVKEIGNEIEIDFFNRMTVLTEVNGQKTLRLFQEIKEEPETVIYHPTLQNISDLRRKEKLTIKDYLTA